jgi:hypothetical protein
MNLKQEAERRETLKAQHRELFAELTRIFAEEDPKGLMSDDASNADEYEAEVGTILPRLSECDSCEDVQEVIADEFNRWFNGDGGNAHIQRQSAERIWEAWNAHKRR